MKKSVLHPRTALINAIQKKESKKTRTQALQWLADTFPEAFDNKIRIRPLQIGILDAILEQAELAQQQGISKSKLREAVVIYTRRLDYLVCLKARETRVDLQGKPCTQVTEEEAASAAIKVKKRVENHIKHVKKTTTESVGWASAQQPPQGSVKSPQGRAVPSAQESFPVYPLRANHTESKSATAKPTTVMVKHKTTRAYDPDAVARLKEKLGISNNSERLPE
jgi:ProP effector